MRWTSALAIYALFWALTLFIVLPFHSRRDPDATMVPGQADSAPSNFSIGRATIQVTILAGLLFGLYYWNYVAGFVSFNDINPLPAPPRG
jgi:predicted secreted protein